MDRLIRPHDLLWGMAPERLPADAPAWARRALASGQPVVVRRAIGPTGQVAVGIRGTRREQRLAAWMPVQSISRQLCPEQLRLRGEPSCAALHALVRISACLDATGLAWGPSGGAGFQLASGIEVLHDASDLDLILRTEQPFERRQAVDLLAALEQAPCRIDLQLETPNGAVALREWAGGSQRVLLKCASGARLVDDPWNIRELAA
ncbi:malonate decarboxylase holo-ACP synthase [Pseudomonas sp. LRF_L74]|uniref:malonate decarboxylase holo-ACP synthase n=1 Tax=Pseudomonas sp. LRF_L74 TaxID=3369422 RepID=UPI003F6045B8